MEKVKKTKNKQEQQQEQEQEHLSLSLSLSLSLPLSLSPFLPLDLSTYVSAQIIDVNGISCIPLGKLAPYQSQCFYLVRPLLDMIKKQNRRAACIDYFLPHI